MTPLAHAKKMIRAIPDARLVVLERSGHLAFAEEPAAFTKAIRSFLEADH